MVQWRFNNGFLPVNAFPDNQNTLHLRHINANNQGYYECKGTTLKNETFTAQALLNVIGELNLVNN